jgi:hypothetical protein
MLLLVGEQPAPNLLPARHLNPDAAVLVHTDRTAQVARNPEKLLEPSVSCSLCQVDPYDVAAFQRSLQQVPAAHPQVTEWLFNLTGGTKPMALAALLVAQQQDYPFVYFQTEGNQSRLVHYRFDQAGVALVQVEEVPATISIDDHLRMYLGSYAEGEPRDPFEEEVVVALRSDPAIDEVLTSLKPQGLGALEVDFAVRCGNQVGIGEVKSQGQKKGIDQLAGVTRPQYLGTYVARFLVSGGEVHPNNRELARAYGIDVIELPSYGMDRTLSPQDQQTLRETIVRRLTRRS